MWLKVTKSVVSSTKEAYIADVYNNPRNSIYSKKNDLNKLYIFLDNNEDFNSRVGTEPDFITENENDFHFYQKDTNKS